MAAARKRRTRRASTNAAAAAPSMEPGTIAQQQPKLSRRGRKPRATAGTVGTAAAPGQIGSSSHRELVARLGSGYWRDLCDQNDQFAAGRSGWATKGGVP